MVEKKVQNRKRHVILHYHIFKNAGTTIHFILERNFGKRMRTLDAPHFNASLSNDVLLEFLKKHTRIQAISTHHLLPPKPEDEHFVFYDILFLRHPLARLSSMYAFYRRSDVTEDPLTAEAKKRTMAEFMRLLMDRYPHYVNNAQMEYLLAGNRGADQDRLQAAFRVASQATVLGTAEMFDLGAVLAEESLTPFFKSLSFNYVAQNVSLAQPRQLGLQLDEFREACGEELYEQLLKLNRLDIELLLLAQREISRRFEQIPDHEERLRKFVFWRGILHPSSIRGVLASNHSHNLAYYANIGKR